MLAYYVLINVITLVVWGIDKYKAVQHLWRIPERWLFALVLVGGSFGALAGMSFFRHKTRKLLFWILAIICSVIHTVLILLMLK